MILVSIAGLVGTLLGGDEIKIVEAVIFGIVRRNRQLGPVGAGHLDCRATILKTEHTEADWGQLARCTGFAQTPWLLSVLSFLPFVGGLILLVAFIWSFVAMMVGVRQALDYTSTWRAFFVILIALPFL